jgi:hypothetical protein
LQTLNKELKSEGERWQACLTDMRDEKNKVLETLSNVQDNLEKDRAHFEMEYGEEYKKRKQAELSLE